MKVLHQFEQHPRFGSRRLERKNTMIEVVWARFQAPKAVARAAGQGKIIYMQG